VNDDESHVRIDDNVMSVYSLQRDGKPQTPRSVCQRRSREL